jgi:hypothetical protein
MNQQFRRGTRYHLKQPNALKHGVFTLVAMLPGEDPKLFAALHAGLSQEWSPDGPTEKDAALALQKLFGAKPVSRNFFKGK